MMLQKHALITAALLATLTLSACGKKTEIMNPPAEGSGETTDKKTKDNSDDTSGSLGGALADPDEESQELPGTPDQNNTEPTPVKPKASPSPKASASAAPKAPSAPQVDKAPSVPKPAKPPVKGETWEKPGYEKIPKAPQTGSKDGVVPAPSPKWDKPSHENVPKAPGANNDGVLPAPGYESEADNSPSERNPNDRAPKKPSQSATSQDGVLPAPSADSEKQYPQPPPVVRGQPAAPSVADVKSAPEVGRNVVPDAYNPSNPQNVTRDSTTKRLTGAVTKQGYVYTSSSTDELLNFLRKRNERVGADSRRQNLAAAASVVAAKISTDSFAGDNAVVTLKVQEGSSVKVYNLAGSIGEGPASVLRPVNAGNGERSTGNREIKGTLKCLDLDGGCETTFARIELGSKGSSGIINVVFRKSSADLYFHLPAVNEYSGNPEFYTLSDFFISTIKRRDTPARIKTRSLQSFEVVNGRSGFTVSMKGFNGELLSFAGPLLSQEAGSAINVPLARIGKDQENSLDLISVNASKLNYANTIGEARLIANNGLGQIRLAFQMRKRSNYKQDRFAVTVMRVIKPIVELEDQNLK